jgi:hypothetical protein
VAEIVLPGQDACVAESGDRAVDYVTRDGAGKQEREPDVRYRWRAFGKPAGRISCAAPEPRIRAPMPGNSRSCNDWREKADARGTLSDR